MNPNVGPTASRRAARRADADNLGLSRTSVRKTTCPRDCYDRCGLLAHTRDGKVVRVTGDPHHPHTRGAICAKCAKAYNGVWLDQDARLASPMRRTGPKGQGSFEPISWEEALREIAERMQLTIRTRGPEHILHAHFQGTYSALACHFPCRLFNHIGATEVEPSTICDKAGHVALNAMYGTSFVGFDPRTANDADVIVMWGINPAHSAPVTDRFWLKEFAGLKIVIDPVRTPTADKADLHLQLKPGSDIVLAYGMLHVLARNNLIDHAFVQRHVRGWESIEARLASLDLGVIAARTELRVADIEEAALRYGRGKALLWLGIGLQRQLRGGDTVRAAGLLPAATGKLGRGGEGFLYMNGYESIGASETFFTHGPAEVQGPRISHMHLASALSDAERSSIFFNWNMNVAASAPNQLALRKALTREDLFTVVVDIFPTDTAAFADILLPAATFLEFDDVVLSYFQRTISAQAKAVEPFASSLPNQEIFRRLARALGLAAAHLHQSDEEVLGEFLHEIRPGLRFADLRAAGTIFASDTIAPQFEGLEFPTPSGRIEIDSDVFIREGLGASPDLEAADPGPKQKLTLISPSHPFLINSTYGNDPRILARIGEPAILVNPRDAEARLLNDGDWVEVLAPSAVVRMKLQVSDIVKPGVAVCYKSRWPSGDPGGTNVNALNPGLTADVGGATAVNSLEVDIRAALA